MDNKTSYTILVVDDDWSFFYVILNIFVDYNLNCELATSDHEARIRWKNKEYDAIILDLAMDQNSFSHSRQLFCEEVRKENPLIPVIAVTGKPMTSLQGFKLANFNVDAFFIKQSIDILDFRLQILDLIQHYKKSEIATHVPACLPSRNTEKETSVFLSYSHKDRIWRDELLQRLLPYVTHGRMTYWVDKNIRTGDDWENAIKDAIDASRVAVLIMSNAYLASEYIKEKELPYILSQQSSGELNIVWFTVETCPYDLLKEVTKREAAYNPKEPLDIMSTAMRKKVLAEICRKIAKL